MSRSFVLVMVALALVSGAALAQSQPSLAEQAAAARRDQAGPSLDPKIAGRVVAGEYHNDFFGFSLKPLPGWEALDRGQMNVDEAIGRDAAGMKGGVDASASGRVFGMHDAMGSSVFLSIKEVPPGTVAVVPKLQAALREQISDIHFLRETVLLGDSAHRFDGFRAAYTLRDAPINQSLEFLFQGQDPKRYLITLTVTAPTQEKLTAVLRDLQARLQWTSTAGN